MDNTIDKIKLTKKLLQVLSRMHDGLTEAKLVRLMDNCLDTDSMYVIVNRQKQEVKWVTYDRNHEKLDRMIDSLSKSLGDDDRFTISMSKKCPQCKELMDVESLDDGKFKLKCTFDICNLVLNLELKQEADSSNHEI